MSVEKFTEALKSLMPRGFIWSYSAGTNLDLFLKSFATECNRIALKAIALIDEADPRTCSDMIADFERVLGIVNTSAVLSDRRATVVERLQTLTTITEAQMLELFESYMESSGAAADLEAELGAITGYSLTREPVFQSGYSHSGDPINGEQWTHFVWVDIDIVDTDSTGFEALLASLSVYATTLLQAHERAYPRLV